MIRYASTSVRFFAASVLAIWLLASFQTTDLKSLERRYISLIKENKKAEAAKVAMQIANEARGDASQPGTPTKYYKITQELATQLKDMPLLAAATQQLGEHYASFLDTQTDAVEQLNAAYKLYRELQRWNEQCETLYALGKLFFARKEYQRANNVLSAAIRTAQEHNIRFGRQLAAEKLLAEIEKRTRPDGPVVAQNRPGQNTQLDDKLRELESNYNDEIKKIQSLRDQNETEYRLAVERLQKEKEMKEIELMQNARELQIMKELQEEQARSNRSLRIIMLMAVVVLLLMVVAYIIKRRDHRKLERHREEIMKQKDEIELKNQQIALQKEKLEVEKQKADDLLANILPAPVATELKDTGVYLPRAYRSVTVFFSDFKGFTETAGRVKPEDLVEELNICFSAFDQIVEEMGIEKIKTIGDAYMCAAGLPIPDEDHAIRMVKAALKMQQFMERRSFDRQLNNEFNFQMRIGINTGPVIAGIVGQKKFAYDIWGDAVNIAARLEAASEVGRINISGSTYELVKDHFYCNYRGLVPAKNKGEIEMYFVNGEINAYAERSLYE